MVLFSITYITFSYHFPHCHHDLYQKELVHWYLFFEITGRTLVIYLYLKGKEMVVEKASTSTKTTNKSFPPFELGIKLFLLLYVSMLVLFFHYSGCRNVCTWLYISNSLTVVVDVLVYLLNCQLKHCIARCINTIMLRKEKKLVKKEVVMMCDANETEVYYSSYSSDTVEDLHFELELLVRRNINNFFNIFRMSFTIYTLIMVLQAYKIQLFVSIYGFKTLLLLLFHVITFVSVFVESTDAWTCYNSLSDNEMKPILLSQQAVTTRRSRNGGENTSPSLSISTNTVKPTSKRVLRKRKTTNTTSNNNNSSRKQKKPCSNHVNNTTDTDTDTDTDEHEEPAPEGEVCSICLSAHNIETIKLKACQHQFHEGCLLCLLRVAKNEKAKKCPICRALIIPSTSHLWHDNDGVPFHIPHM